MLVVSPLTPAHRQWLEEEAQRIFNGKVVVSRGVAHEVLTLPGFMAEESSVPVGVAVYNIVGDQCELVSIDAFRQWRGIGSALIDAVEGAARQNGAQRLWLITTNDNVDAMRFYQKRGFKMKAVYPGSLNESRKIKPQIPLLGNYGIPMSDEVELEKIL